MGIRGYPGWLDGIWRVYFALVFWRVFFLFDMLRESCENVLRKRECNKMSDFGKNETITCYDMDGNIVAKFNPGEPLTANQLFAGIPNCTVIRGHNRLGNIVQTIRRQR